MRGTNYRLNCSVLTTVLALFCIIGSLGCASVIVRKVPVTNPVDIEGLRFYRPTPYLLVSEVASESKESTATRASQANSLQFSIVWMPDLSEEYVIRAKPGLGSIEYSPTLENGWNLTGLNAKADSKAAELLTAVAGLIPKAAPGRPEQAPALKPGMYPFEFEMDQHSPNYGHLKRIGDPIFVIK